MTIIIFMYYIFWNFKIIREMFWSYYDQADFSAYQWKCQRSVYAFACAHTHASMHTRTYLSSFKKLVRYCGSAFFFFLLFLFWLDKPLDFFCPFVLYLHFPVLGAKALSDLHRVSVSCSLTEGHHSYKGFFGFPLFSCGSVKNMF